MHERRHAQRFNRRYHHRRRPAGQHRLPRHGALLPRSTLAELGADSPLPAGVHVLSAYPGKTHSDRSLCTRTRPASPRRGQRPFVVGAGAYRRRCLPAPHDGHISMPITCTKQAGWWRQSLLGRSETGVQGLNEQVISSVAAARCATRQAAFLSPGTASRASGRCRRPSSGRR